MFQIKICGITDVHDGQMVAAAGADAIGLNFYPRSPRCVDMESAKRIVETVSADVLKVGLFVNAKAKEVAKIYDDLGLGLIQLHGDEPPKFLAKLSPRPVVRAFRLGEDGFEPILRYLQRCRDLCAPPEMILIDAHVEGQYGGTGEVADWATIRESLAENELPPLVLAGGLTPANVADAINAVGPAAVDTASGVEASPGRKDPAAVEAFVHAAKEGLAQA